MSAVTNLKQQQTRPSQPDSKSWTEFVQKYKPLDILLRPGQPINPQDLAFVPKSSGVLESLQNLNDRTIWSIPIYDSKNNEFNGIVDIFDILTFLIKRQETIALHSPDLFHSLYQEMYQTKVESVTGISDRNFWITITEGESNLVDIMSILKTRDIHRVMLMDSDRKKVIAIITQFDVLRFCIEKFYNWISLNPPLPRSSVKDQQQNPPCSPLIPSVKDFGNYLETNLIKYTSGETAMNVFTGLVKNKVSAVPIVDVNTGKLVGTLSAMDIRGILCDPYKMGLLLNEDVMSFLVKSKSIQPQGGEKRSVSRQYTCKMEDNLIDVMERLERAEVHRLWIVDDEGKPIGVVGLREVIWALSMLECPRERGTADYLV